jgi:hypothetical protein
MKIAAVLVSVVLVAMVCLLAVQAQGARKPAAANSYYEKYDNVPNPHRMEGQPQVTNNPTSPPYLPSPSPTSPHTHIHTHKAEGWGEEGVG